MHGGELKTALLLHTYSDLVRDDYADRHHDAPHRPDLLVTGMMGYATVGIIGRPSLATRDKVKLILDILSASFGEHVTVLTS